MPRSLSVQYGAAMEEVGGYGLEGVVGGQVLHQRCVGVCAGARRRPARCPIGVVPTPAHQLAPLFHPAAVQRAHGQRFERPLPQGASHFAAAPAHDVLIHAQPAIVVDARIHLRDLVGQGIGGVWRRSPAVGKVLRIQGVVGDICPPANHLARRLRPLAIENSAGMDLCRTEPAEGGSPQILRHVGLAIVSPRELIQGICRVLSAPTKGGLVGPDSADVVSGDADGIEGLVGREVGHDPGIGGILVTAPAFYLSGILGPGQQPAGVVLAGADRRESGGGVFWGNGGRMAPFVSAPALDLPGHVAALQYAASMLIADGYLGEGLVGKVVGDGIGIGVGGLPRGLAVIVSAPADQPVVVRPGAAGMETIGVYRGETEGRRRVGRVLVIDGDVQLAVFRVSPPALGRPVGFKPAGVELPSGHSLETFGVNWAIAGLAPAADVVGGRYAAGEVFAGVQVHKDAVRRPGGVAREDRKLLRRDGYGQYGDDNEGRGGNGQQSRPGNGAVPAGRYAIAPAQSRGGGAERGM